MVKPKEIEPINLVELAETINKSLTKYKEEIKKVPRKVRRARYKEIKKLIQIYNKAVGFTAIYF